ncbi:MAG: K+/H+ antiporter subunit F [Armatimonadetes bacterium]|nr:K+/H+ antiporter subunit F [Armatimonadota bacterium]MDW8029135.1 K+/H+ antiporter subunit F [Armatimonadota bacterium]
MLAQACFLASALLTFGFACCIYRFLRGPSIPDRILALDTLSTLVMAQFIVLCIMQGNRNYMEAALLIALLGFISTTVAAKFLLRGSVME